MTTYLATIMAPHPMGSITLPFCSTECRARYWAPWMNTNTLSIVGFRDDDAYEFDEACNNCCALIPASSAVQESR